MTYNLTDIEQAANPGALIIATNTLSNTYYFSGLLVTLFIIILVVIKQMGFDYGVAFLTSCVATVFIGALILYIGGIGWVLYGIFLGLSIISLFVFALGGK